MKKVLIPTKLDSVAREMLADNGNYNVIQDDSVELVELAKQHPDAYAIFVRSEKVTPEIIDLLPELKVVIRAGAGYNTIDTKYARVKGVDVMNTPGANANAVAEEVVALMLADARHVIAADASTRAGLWEKSKFMGKEITGKTIGIVGFGAIGRLVATRLAGFDMRILAFDPFFSADRAADFGVELVELKDLFAQSDYVSLHIPANNETKGIVNNELLSLMKSNATIVNCARAEIINEDDLRAAKTAKGIRYLNDVYLKDAAGEKTIADIANIMLPHLGASTQEANYNAARRSSEQLIDFDEKGIASYIVNREVPAGLDEEYGELAFTVAKLARQILGTQHKLKLMETSFYGDLKNFADWLVVPVVAALSDDFDRSMSGKAALEYLKEQGVDYVDRETSEVKGYGNSITLDLVVSTDGDTLKRVSIRGTVAEGNLMIARINDFDKLYFEPAGHTAIFTYNDRPGILGQIASTLAEAGVNIDDVRNPHDSKGEKSIAILKLGTAINADTVAAVRTKIAAENAAFVSL
jgi:D-3-phosphoglycerate dehydrogenase